MGLTTGGGGDDKLQVGLVVFITVISLMTALAIPMIAPGWESTGYSYEEVASERQNLESFTGETMTNSTPWAFEMVYTPYVPGSTGILNDAGWLYGGKVEDYPGLSTSVSLTTTGIRLDPDHKSVTPLGQGISEISVKSEEKWYYNGAFGWVYDLSKALGGNPDRYKTTEEEHPAWNFTGYLYEFDPMVQIVTKGSNEQKTTEDAKLSVVWYDTDGQEGISSGLVLYSEKTKGMVANYTSSEIVSNYKTTTSYASTFTFKYEGTTVDMHIRFDPEVISSEGADLYQAWTEGKWTLAFSAISGSNFLDINNSTSFTSSLGNLIDTYVKVFTFSLPNAPPMWSMVLWILCILPAEIAVMMFLSRFGLAGIGAGILGNVMAFIGLT